MTTLHAAHGFWQQFGYARASVDFCEPNYVVTFYVAEFWNTVSCALPCYATFLLLQNNWRKGLPFHFNLLAGLLALVAWGSVAFHGTLQRWGQVVDEFAMILAAPTYLDFGLVGVE